MLVSVLMSVYKEKTTYLREAIESILNQTYTDFEFVIVGDTPLSDRERIFGVIEEYASKDSRIKFYPNENNIGLTKSLNVGLSHCSGKYIARMDADDVSVLTRLEKQVLFMESNPNILASSAWFEFIDEYGKLSGSVVRNIESPKIIHLNILKNSVMGHPVSIYHRVINNMEVRYDESMKYAQDYMLWVWILQYGDISNIQETLLFYRISKNQISTKHLPEQQNYAKMAQIKAFKLHDLPIVESFMSVFSSLTVEYGKKIVEKDAKKGFQEFFAVVDVTKNNYLLMKFIIDIYISYFSNYINKKRYHFLYDITKTNKKLLFLCEMDYLYHKITGKSERGQYL